MDYIRPTPMENPLLGLLAERLKQAQGFVAKPFGYSNPPAEMLMNLLGIPAVQQTMERMAYGEPLTTGRGMTTQVRPEVAEAALTVAPAAGLLAKATKGMPVGMSIKNVGDDILSYRGSHQAPNARRYGATLDDLTKILPDDVYSAQGKQLYGIGDRTIDSEWRVAALKTRNKPDAEVEVYRAVPKGVKDINDGDWVSTSKAYAKQHGESTLNGEYDIVTKKVKAKTLSTEGYPYEYGYNKEFEFPQQGALDTAQKNAALPISEGGLGLPPNNTPMDRARAMGAEDVLHGTSSSIEQVNTQGRRYVNPFYVTENASDDAIQFANNFANTKPEMGNPTMYPLMIRQSEVLDTRKGIPQNLIDAAQKSNEELKIGSKGLPSWGPVNNYATAAKEGGIKALLLDERPNLNSIAVLDPSIIRSRFAAFDPMRRNEADILAGLLPASLLADPETRRKLDEELSLLYTK